MTVINLTTLASGLGAPAATDAWVQCTPWSGSRPAVRVSGEQVIVSDTASVRVTLGVPEETLDLEPNGITWCWKILTYTTSPSARLTRYVNVPPTGPIDFEDLVDVDPATFIPTPDVVAGWDAAFAALPANLADPETPEGAAVAGVAEAAAAEAASSSLPLAFFSPPAPIVPTTEPVTVQWTANGASGGETPVSGATDPSALWDAPAGYTLIQMHAEATPQAWFSHGIAKAMSKGGDPLIGNETVRVGYRTSTWGLGFTTNATVIEVTGYIANQVDNRKRPHVLIDGRPITADFPTDVVAGATSFGVLTLQFPEARKRTIEILHNWIIGSIRYNDTASMVPWNRGAAPRLYIEGDSWVEGTTQSSPLPSWAHALMVSTPWQVAPSGIGGTAYATGSTDDRFGSAARRTAITAFDPDVVLIAGSIGDNAASAAVAAAATAHWAALKAALPDAIIAVFGPQHVPGYEAAAEANRVALMGAAAASANVGYYRDSIAERWAASAWMTGADPIHPSRMGAYVYADLATTAVRLAAQLNGDNRW